MKNINNGILVDSSVEANRPAASTPIGANSPAVVQKLISEQAESDALTANESMALCYLERDIQYNLTSFLRAGKALAQIRDQRLYRKDYSTFAEYCEKRWQISRASAYRMIGEANVNKFLSPIGDKTTLPELETQYRELLGLSPEQIPLAWENAVTVAQGKPITAEIVRQAAAKFKVSNKVRRMLPERCVDGRQIDGDIPVKLGNVAAEFVSERSIRIAFAKLFLKSEQDIDAYLRSEVAPLWWTVLF